MLENKLENACEGHQSGYENKGGREIAIKARRTISLSNSSWIKEICRIPNETIILEKNTTKSTKTKDSHGMVEKGTVKGLGSQIVKMMLGRGEDGAGAEHVRHHK
jgi:hypothetical protein